MGREPRRDQRERHRCGPPAAPARFPARRRPPTQRRGGRCQGREAPSAAQGSLDSRSPPSRYTFISAWPGWGCCRSWAPLGAAGALAPPAASASRAGFAAGARGRGRRRVGGGQNSGMGAARSQRKPPRSCSASRATHRTRSAPQQSPLEGVGGDRKQWHGRSAAEPVPTALPLGGADGAEQGARVERRRAALPPVRCSASSAAATGRRQSTPRRTDRGGDQERTDRMMTQTELEERLLAVETALQEIQRRLATLLPAPHWLDAMMRGVQR